MYFRPESVDLAIQMLDDTDFRLGQSAPGGKMKVVAADFSYKAQKDAPAKSNMKDKKKIMKKTQKLNKYVSSFCSDPVQMGGMLIGHQQTRRLGRRRSRYVTGNQLTMGQSCHIEAHVYSSGTRSKSQRRPTSRRRWATLFCPGSNFCAYNRKIQLPS